MYVSYIVFENVRRHVRVMSNAHTSLCGVIYNKYATTTIFNIIAIFDYSACNQVETLNVFAHVHKMSKRVGKHNKHNTIFELHSVSTLFIGRQF